LAKLETLPSAKVRPSRVAASPVQFECVVTQIVQLEAQGGAAGEIVHAAIHRRPLDGVRTAELGRRLQGKVDARSLLRRP